jgi:hypothetical protein
MLQEMAAQTSIPKTFQTLNPKPQTLKQVCAYVQTSW